MSIDEIKSAINFGKETIAEFKSRGLEAPEFIYERIIELQDMLIGTDTELPPYAYEGLELETIMELKDTEIENLEK